MSIVAAMMFSNGGVVMYADKRAVTKFGNNTIVSDSYLKVHRISKTVVCGITGWAEWGLLLVHNLSTINLDRPSKMIEFIKLYPYPAFDENFGSTVTLGGIYDDGKPFLWTYRTSGNTTFDQEGINYSVATNPENLGTACSNFLEEKFQETNNPDQTLQSVIKFAATRSPETISQEYDRIAIPFKL